MSFFARLVVLFALALVVQSPGEAGAQSANALLQKGIRHYNVGQLKESLTVLRRALKASRSSRQKGKIYLYLALTNAVLGKKARARRLVSLALAHDPSMRLDPRRFKPSLVKLVNRARARRRRALRRRTKLRKRAAAWRVAPEPRAAARPPAPAAPAAVTTSPAPAVAAPEPSPVVAEPAPPPAPAPVKQYAPVKAGAGELIIRTERPGCRVHLNGKIVGTTPLMETVPAGEHLVAVESHDGRRSWQARVTVSSSNPTRISAVIPAPARAPVPQLEDPKGGGARLAWTWITAGLGLAAAGVGTGLMVSASQDYEEYKQTTDAKRFEELDGQVRKKRTGAYVSFGVAGAMAVVALVLHVTRPSPPQAAAARPGRAGPVLSFEF